MAKSKISTELLYTDASGFKKVLTGQTVLFRNAAFGSDKATTEISTGVYESNDLLDAGIWEIVINTVAQNRYIINLGIDGQYILDNAIISKHINDEAVTNAKIADEAIDDRTVDNISATLIGNGDVSDTELSYINSLSSNAQTQLASKIGIVTGAEDVIPVFDSRGQLIASDYEDTDLATLYGKLISSYDYHITYNTTLDGSGNLAITDDQIKSMMAFATDGTEEILAGVTCQIFYITDFGTYKTRKLANYVFGSGKEITEKDIPYAGTGIEVLDTISATGGTASQAVTVVLGFNKVNAKSNLRST